MLRDHLVLNHVQNEDDIQRLAAFNAMIHDETVGDMTRHMLLDHPTISQEWDKWLFIEDTQSHEILSALCLITWHFDFDGVTLKAGEVGIVGTHPDHRSQGLSSRLMARHRELLQSHAYDLSHIQGIPYFYRRYGYEYAIPLEGGHRLYLETIPQAATGFTLRKATSADVPQLVAWYPSTNQTLNLSARRDAAIWDYLLGAGMHTETAADTWIVQNADGAALGYCRIAQLNGFGPALVLNEVSALPHAAYIAVLQHAKAIAQDRDAPYLRLNIPASQPLVALAKQFDASDHGTYAWQILLPNPAALLHKLAPIFESRLAASPFVGMTRTVVISTYRAVYALVFENGRLQAVNTSAHGLPPDFSLPPTLLTPLVLGQRTFAEIARFFPDALANPDSQTLIDTLFPSVAAFVHTQY